MDDTHDMVDDAAAGSAGTTEGLLSIGAFARTVGLAPSALRFYDDCAVLRPAHVDTATGYRYYAEAQQPRAALLRRLREAELPQRLSAVVPGPGPGQRLPLGPQQGERREVVPAPPVRARGAPHALLDEARLGEDGEGGGVRRGPGR